MDLRKKTLVYITVLVTISFIVFHFTAQYMLMGNFEKIEDKEYFEDVQKLLNLVDDDIKKMIDIGLNYSVWDDTYKFANSKDRNFDKKTYIESNYADEMFLTNRFNLFAIYNLNHQTLFYKEYNLEKRNVIRPTNELIDMIQNNKEFLFDHNDVESKAGIILVKGKPMFVISLPIVHSNLKGPSCGVIIIGKYVDKSIIDKLSEKSRLFIEFSNEKEYNSVDENERMLFSDYFGLVNIKIQRKSEKMISYFMVFKTINRDLAFVVKIEKKREVYLQGKDSINYFITFSIIGAVVCTVLTLFFLEKNFISRVYQLNKSINQIIKTKDLSSRVKISGNDQLTKLGISFNEMMSVIEEYQKKIEYQAYHDNLTGLINRAAFFNILNEEIICAEESSNNVAVLFIDLDEFKKVNDTYGHDIGDLLLQVIAKRIINCANSNNTVARLGGDEFTVIIPFDGNLSIPNDIAKKIKETLENEFKLKNHIVYITGSIGISIYPYDGVNADELVKNADTAMFEVKSDGKNNFKLCSSNKNNGLP